MILFDYDKAVHLMERQGIDILLPHTLMNAGYLADHWVHDQHTSFHPYMALDMNEVYLLMVGLPRDQQIEPFITCRRDIEEGDMYSSGVWIEDRLIWGPNMPPRSVNTPLPPVTKLYPTPFEAAAFALKERGLHRSTIGVEYRNLGVDMFETLGVLLPDAEFRDVGPLFRELRVVKSDEEIRRIRHAVKATEAAHKVFYQNVRPGMTGLDIESLYGLEHYRAGARHEWMHIWLGIRGIEIECPDAAEVKAGEFVGIDVGCSYKHYTSDVLSMTAVGDPNPKIMSIHAAILRAYDATLEVVRPGTPVKQVYETGKLALEREGIEPFIWFLGHGIGRDVHDEPYLDKGSKYVLEKNMPLALEFSIREPELGGIAVEDNILVTADGYENLSTTSREMHFAPV